MGPIVLLKIECLHARASQADGLKIRQRGRELNTGTICAHLDGSAESPANMGIVDLATGAIQLRWAIIATMPFVADAFAAGAISPKESSPVRILLEESGQVLDDGSGFDVSGTGQVDPGSILSPVKIPMHNNVVQIHRGGVSVTIGGALAAGKTVRCVLVPDSCYLDVALPQSLGGATQRLNLVGGFHLVPIMILAQPTQTKRPKRTKR